MRFVAAAGKKMSVQYHLNFHVCGISCLPLKKDPCLFGNMHLHAYPILSQLLLCMSPSITTFSPYKSLDTRMVYFLLLVSIKHFVYQEA
jgi:hypothetical protein